MKEKYYLIKTNDKGFSSVTEMDKPAVDKFLKEITEDEDSTEILDQFLIPKKSGIDLAYEGNSYLLIKGEAIKPKVAEKITKLEVE